MEMEAIYYIVVEPPFDENEKGTLVKFHVISKPWI